MEAKKFQKVINLLQEYARLYNYNFAFDEAIEDDFDKRFVIDNYDKLRIITKGSQDNNLIAEHVSLLDNLFKTLGLDPIVSMKENTELQDYLNYLSVDYETDNNTSEIICSYLNNDTILGYTDTDKKNNTISVIDISCLIDEIPDLEDYSIDVYIIANSNEEKLKASILLNDLRLCDVVCDTCYEKKDKEEQIKDNNARNIIILEDEELQKGLITVKDNLTGEETKIPEDEIIEYILGVI